MRPLRSLAALAAVVAVPAAAQQPAQKPAQAAAKPPAPTGAFIVRLGTDTTAVERFTRSGNAWAVEQARRSPRTGFFHTHVEITPAGDIGEVFYMNHGIGKDAPPLLATVRLRPAGGDSATVEIKRGSDSVRTRRATLRAGMIPNLPGSFLAYELAAMRLRAARGDSMSVMFLGPAGDTMPIVVSRVGADSMTFRLPFLTYRARVDAEGRIQSLYQPLGTSVERVSDVDVNRLAAAWKGLDDAGRSFGFVSPADSTKATVAGANVAVFYGRPKARGRAVFGNLVPFGAVWRTGANAATILSTDRDLDIGGTRLPAGKYSLFTVNTDKGSTLVISRETERGGQPLAGTEYDQKNDFARIPMRVTALAEPVEQLTIDVVPQGADRGDLRIRWEKREMTVPIRAAAAGR